MTDTAMVAAAGNLELERYMAGPAPYSSGNPVPPARIKYPTAEQELAAALEGQGPMLAREIAPLLGPHRTVMLARAISRAVAVGIRRRGEQTAAEVVAGAYDLLVAGLDQVTDGCSTPELEAEAERTCRVCGCSEADACLVHDNGRLTGVCTWVAADLCSECQRKQQAADRG